ncbi:MAG: hypothetical protein ACYC35_16005 [Pirellulales bacterium]
MVNPIHPEPTWPEASRRECEVSKDVENRQKETAGKECSRPGAPQRAGAEPAAMRHGGDTVGRERLDW